MATYYSHLLNRAISYDKNLINQKEIEEIIQYCYEFRSPKYYTNGIDVYKWIPKQNIWLFHTHFCFLNKKQKYYIRMCEKIEEIFIKQGKKK